MKRIGGNIYEEIISVDNLIAADIIARKDKDCTGAIAKWDRNWAGNIALLNGELREMVYEPGKYFQFKTKKADRSAKVRVISVCIHYRDRVVHQAVIQVLSKYMTSKFTDDTYASIPGRGAHQAVDRIKELMGKKGDRYCLKMDVHKFFPSANGDIMIDILKRVVKCRKTIDLLIRIVNSAKNLPIGNLTSQWFGNLYLAEIDHIAKELWKAENYYRYCDDIIIIDKSKEKLQVMEIEARKYLREKRKLELNNSWAVFKISEKKREGRGLDFLGCVMYRQHTDLRKSTKMRWKRNLHKLNDAPTSEYDVQAAGSLHGILKHCDSKNLLKKFKHDYPKYFARLLERKAAKHAAAEYKRKQLAVVLPASADNSGNI